MQAKRFEFFAGRKIITGFGCQNLCSDRENRSIEPQIFLPVKLKQPRGVAQQIIVAVAFSG